MPRVLMLVLLSSFSFFSFAQPPENNSSQERAQDKIDSLEKPMYTPFVELYMMEELKHLRSDMADQRIEIIQTVVDREIGAVDRAIAYATDTITYFFYTIAAASTILVLVGWNSIREIKERVHIQADEKVTKLVQEYEDRLRGIEFQLNQKTQHIEANREEIGRTQEVQSLWLRAAQEDNLSDRIHVYDQILKLRVDDVEALTYKADAVLELGEPQWAANLCQQALEIDSENPHAFYQLACAYVAMDRFEESVDYLRNAIEQSDSYREKVIDDPEFEPIKNFEPYQKLVNRS